MVKNCSVSASTNIHCRSRSRPRERSVLLFTVNPRQDLIGYTRKETISLLLLAFWFWRRDQSCWRRRNWLHSGPKMTMGMRRMGTTRRSTVRAPDGLLKYSSMLAISIMLNVLMASGRFVEVWDQIFMPADCFCRVSPHSSEQLPKASSVGIECSSLL